MNNFLTTCKMPFFLQSYFFKYNETECMNSDISNNLILEWMTVRPYAMLSDQNFVF